MRKGNRFFVIYVCLGLLVSACGKDKPQQPVNPIVLPVYEIQPAILKPVTETINATIGGFYSAVPFHYADSNKKYPLLVFLPGGGQYGNGKLDLPLLLNDGIPQLLDEKKFPPDFNVNGEHFSFIVLAPQFSRYPATDEIKSFLNYALDHYRIDASRIYISGLSIGGTVAADVAAEYTNLVAAIVPISGTYNTDSTLSSKSKKITGANIPVWMFHNQSDPLSSSTVATTFYSLLNSYHPLIQPKLTMFTAAKHDAWTQALNPDYKEDKKNIYEWMLQYHR